LINLIILYLKDIYFLANIDQKYLIINQYYLFHHHHLAFLHIASACRDQALLCQLKL